MRHSQSIPLTLALTLATTQAHATTYRDLCTSIPDQCDYTGPNAPVLAANVCWSRATSTSRLMTGATCPSGSYPFSLKYGVVDPLSGIVAGFVPLDDACSRPGLCLPGSFAPPTTTPAPMCCVGDQCWTIEAGLEPLDCEGEILYCTDGATNDDGTVSCFDDDLA